MRNWTTTFGLVLGLISANLIGTRSATADDLQHKFAQIERHAERVFKLLDKDNNGTIAGTEMAALPVHVQREMWTMKNMGVLGGTTWLGPVPGSEAAVPDRDAITLPQFTTAFLATAIQLDGEIRVQRVEHAYMAAARLAADEAAIYNSEYGLANAGNRGTVPHHGGSIGGESHHEGHHECHGGEHHHGK